MSTLPSFPTSIMNSPSHSKHFSLARISGIGTRHDTAPMRKAMNSQRGRWILLLVLGWCGFAVTNRAPAQSDPPSTAHFTQEEILDPSMLAQKIVAQADPVSAFVWGKLSSAAQQSLGSSETSPEARSALLVEGLNSIVDGSGWYDAERFAGVPLSPSTMQQLPQAAGGSNLSGLNRMLLEDAYPLELLREAPLPAGARVVTDKADYAPGSTAGISGAGFQGGETVSLQVVHADGTLDSGAEHAPWTAVADAAGGFQTSWYVCEDDCLGATLRLTAIGQSSARTASAVFTDATGSPTYQRLVAFSGAMGTFPYSGVIQGSDGALYGTTIHGAGPGLGTVFKVNTDGTGFSVLKTFNGTTDGSHLYGPVMQAANGALYGTAAGGGSLGAGTLYMLNPNGTGFVVLFTFGLPGTGRGPQGGLTQGTDGMLYGTTYTGGAGSLGTVFRVNPDGSGFSTLFSFTGGSTGFNPSAGVIQGADGALYGTALNGGTLGRGTVYRLNPNGTGFAVLKTFDLSTSGAAPYATLVQGPGGVLYGTAQYGGSLGYGTVFRVNPNGSGFAVLKSFDLNTNGGYLYSGVTLGTDGALYGAAYGGGSAGYGTLYTLNPDGTGFTVLQNFDTVLARGYPFSTPIQGTDRALYGTTNLSSGTVYRLSFGGPPTANAGADFSVNEGQLVALDGTASDDPDNDPLSYAWVQMPGGTPVALSGANTAMPSFTAPAVALGGETLSFELTVSANGETSTDTVSVTVVNVNHPPVADAGLDQSIAEGSPVLLHGEDSFDIDNDPFGCTWVQVSGPTVGLLDAATATPSFVAPYFGSSGAPGVVATLVFELRVDDGYPLDQPAPGYTFADAVDSVTIEITNVNNDPIAAAGDDQTVDEHTPVSLSGGGSIDPDSDTLTYSWTQIGGPAVALSGAFSATPGFTAPFVGAGGADLEFRMTIQDGYGGLATDTVVVHVQNANDPPLASAARPTVALLWPPNHALVPVGITGVSDPDNNATITITGVTQDEPTNGLGDGDTAIDAIINADGTVLLRAERSGTGNGRVYHIHFTASDLEGSTSGVVTVCVPRDRKSVAVDGGELFVSTN